MSNLSARRLLCAGVGVSAGALVTQLNGPAAWGAPGGPNLATVCNTTGGDLSLLSAGGLGLTVMGASGNVGVGGALNVSGSIAAPSATFHTLVTSNMSVVGAVEVVNAYETHSSNVVIACHGTGPALLVSQAQGVAEYSPVAQFFAGSNVALAISSAGRVGVGTAAPRASLDVNAVDAMVVPVGTTGQRPAAPCVGMVRFNAQTSNVECYYPFGWCPIPRLCDGSSQSTAAMSAASLKLAGVNTSGVYWLQVPNVNAGAPFQCYCDFTIDSGIGFAVIANVYLSGNVYGPSQSTFSGGMSGSADYASAHYLSPTTMLTNYGTTRVAFITRTNSGTAAAGLTSASTCRWVSIAGSGTNFSQFFTNFTPTRFTGAFVASDGSSGTATVPDGHPQGEVCQISSAGAAVNGGVLFEFMPNAGINHSFCVLTGGYYMNDAVFVSGVLMNRWCAIAIY